MSCESQSGQVRAGAGCSGWDVKTGDRLTIRVPSGKPKCCRESYVSSVAIPTESYIFLPFVIGVGASQLCSHDGQKNELRPNRVNVSTACGWWHAGHSTMRADCPFIWLRFASDMCP